MTKKILVIYTTAGAGHMMAARALADVLEQKRGDVEFLCVDALQYTNLIHKNVYTKSYLSLVNYLPSVWGYFYNQFEKKDVLPLNKLLAAIDKINAAPLYNLFEDYKPDHIISTHFLSAELLQAGGIKNISNSVVITDYDAHNLWVYDVVDHYFVATDEVKNSLMHRQVAENKITATGIPVRQIFLEKNSARALPGVKLDRKLKTILLMSGGFGVGRIREIVGALVNIREKFNLVVVVGNNSSLQDELRKRKAPAHVNLTVLGFVENVSGLMDWADLLVSKSGGLTVTESLVKGLPLVITEPIPGQEERNADYVLEVGAGLKAHSLVSLESKVSRLLKNPALLERMRLNALKAARPSAAVEIIEKVLKMI